MPRRRLPKKYKPDPDIPLPVRLGIDQPVEEVDFAIKKTEELLGQLKRLRLVLSRKREKERRQFVHWQNETDSTSKGD